jgi:glycosyltransferase 2 family protein
MDGELVPSQPRTASTPRTYLRIALQAAVSLAIAGILVWTIRGSNFSDTISRLQLRDIAAAICLFGIACLLIAARWRLLLRSYRIHANLSYLYQLYLKGLFFSLFLPSSAGGDAMRVYDLARKSHQPGAAFIATLQERIWGLGGSLIVGLVATCYYWNTIPPVLHVWLVLLQGGGSLGIAALVYPAPLLALARKIGGSMGHWRLVQRLATHPLVARVRPLARDLLQPAHLTWRNLFILLASTLGATLLSIAMHYLIGLSLGMQVSFTAFCLVVPLVWIIRMLPVSLNGLGLGEGAFVFLLHIFGVPKGAALALAVAVLGIQTLFALFGGILYLASIIRQTVPVRRS